MTQKVLFNGVEVNSSSIEDIMSVDAKDGFTLFFKIRDDSNRMEVMKHCSVKLLSKLYGSYDDCIDNFIYLVTTSGKSFKDFGDITGHEESYIAATIVNGFSAEENHRNYSIEEISLLVENSEIENIHFLLDSQKNNVLLKGEKVLNVILESLRKNKDVSEYQTFESLVNKVKVLCSTEEKVVKTAKSKTVVKTKKTKR